MPTLTLSMIVRDAAGDVRACIESVREIVDELVIADTGSIDNTIEIARALGARVISIPWENDFARARNLALAEVHSDWVLSLDADERLDPSAARLLPPLLTDQQYTAYQVPIRNYFLSLSEGIWDRPAVPNHAPFPEAKKYPAYVDHENVRLFRRAPEIYFVGRVHETVGIRVHETGGGLGRADFLIHHFGLAVDRQTQNRKNLYYRDLSLLKIQEMPRNAQAHFELGLVEPPGESAVRCFEVACELKPDFVEAWIFAGLMHKELRHLEQALEAFSRGAKLAPSNSLIAQSLGDIYYDLGNSRLAEKEYRRAQKLGRASPSLESKLGLAQIRNGRTMDGLKRLRKAISFDEGLAELHDRLIVACVWLNLPREAAAAAEEKLLKTTPADRDFLRAASIFAHLLDMEHATELLRIGLSQFPRSESLRAALAEVHPQMAKFR
jgi:tetratricopeptide (TPR) repeat protein